MANAKKLPSGSWRVRVYSYTDSEGKKHYESFTASTKQQAEMMAAKFSNNADRKRASDITVKEAVESYLRANDGVLSPSTILNYTKDSKRLEPLYNAKIRKLTSNDIQSWIAGLSDKGLSPKTIKNTYGLLRSSLAFSGLEITFVIHLPKAQKTRKFAPEDCEIEALYNAADILMKRAIILASRHSLRRGEISGLKYGDLNDGSLSVHSDVVSGRNGWVHKDIPKTDTSNRVIYLSPEECELLGSGDPNDYIVPITPGAISCRFAKLKKRLGLEHIRFHDLRVYFTSISALEGIPEIVTAHHGGWREGSQTLRNHYRRPIESLDKEYARKLNNQFDKKFKL